MHVPVLLKELIYYLDPGPGDTILDATVGGGGHAKLILNAIGKGGRLVGIDQDAVSLEKLKSDLGDRGKNAIFINGNFRNLDELIEPYNVKKIDGAIFDFGMSSVQLEESGRGFTFRKNEPLLMTYKSDPGGSDLTARDIVNKWSEKDISDILKKYGEERYAKKIASNIARQREMREIKTTLDLVAIIEASVPPRYRRSRKINCSTKTFQALRIAVNDELSAVSEGIEKAWNLLSPGAKMVAISFHSLEDKIVKNFFREKAREKTGNLLTKKPIGPSLQEKKKNPRSRSAKLRAIEKAI